MNRWENAYCFNSAWDLIEKQDRTAADDQMMIVLAQASIFHWTQRPDCDDQRLSVGYWQAARVQCLAGNPAEGARLGEICLGYSHNLRPFFVAYAHEALARAYAQMGREADAALQLAAACEHLPMIKDEAARDRVSADLHEIEHIRTPG